MNKSTLQEVSPMLKCPIPGCLNKSKKTPTFSRRDNLKRHLESVHELSDAEIEVLLPSRVVRPRRELSDAGLDERMKVFLKTSKTVEELSSKLDIGVQRVRDSIQRLEEEGLILDIVEDTVKLGKDIAPPKPKKIPMRIYDNTWVRFGVVSDNHLNSKYQRRPGQVSR